LIRINNNIALINNRTYALNAHTGLTKGTIVTDLNALSLDQLKESLINARCDAVFAA
jgi:hypothetical protein